MSGPGACCRTEGGKVKSSRGKVVGNFISLVVFAGIGTEDDEEDCRYMSEKIASLRVFEDKEGKMNLSLLETGGEVLCISQFTLYGDCRKGRRPNFFGAAKPGKAKYLYELLCKMLMEKGLKVETGTFQAMMRVHVENDGPVTILLDSRKNF